MRWRIGATLLVLSACDRSEVVFPAVEVDTLSPSPASLDFGVVFVDEAASRAVRLDWSGADDMEVRLTLTGDGQGAFGLTTVSVTVAPDEPVDVGIVAQPTVAGSPSATLRVSDEDGRVLVSVPLRATAQVDQDRDGFGSAATGGADCDDTDPAIHPGADDVWYDGVDADCAGDDDFDQDHDGSEVALDCDDADPTVGESSEELWNGRDDDCDGERDNLEVTVAASGVVYGSGREAALGLPGTLSAASGLDGSGRSQVVLGEPSMEGGRASVLRAADLPGAEERVDALEDLHLTAVDGLPIGYLPAEQHDVTGDGVDDLLVVGAAYQGYPPFLGSGWLVAGGEERGDDEDIEEVAQAAFFGKGGATTVQSLLAADLDGDGVSEVVVGAPWDSRSSSYSSAYAGAISVFDGGDLQGTLTTSDADVTVYGEQGGAWLGWSVSTVDADGDGYDDLLAAAPGDDEGGPGTGTLYLLAGAEHVEWGSHIESASTARLFGTTRSGFLGFWGVGSVGDADGDGALDWLIGLPSTGMVALATDLRAMSGPHAIEDTPGLWWFPSGDCGSAVDASTDLDGDEVADILVGCPGDDTHGEDAGLVYRLDGRSSSERNASDALATIYGEAAGDALGSEILGRSDVDGDGRADALLGAPGSDGGGEDAGAVYLLTGFGGSAP